jgi:3-oxoacyl-(acyl-carrier-protein) synthase
MGVISPLGKDVETMWKNLLAGKSVTRRITRFDPSNYAVQIGAEVDSFGENDYAEYIDKKEARRMDLFILYTIVAAGQAIKQSALKIGEWNTNDIGALVGTGIGGLTTIETAIRTMLEKGPMRVSPFTGPYMIPNMGAGEIAIVFGVRGPNFSINSACATGTHAIGEA